MKPHLFMPPSGLRHDTGSGHPECPARLAAIRDVLEDAPFTDWPRGAWDEAAWDDIMRAHDEDYVMSLQDALPDNGLRALSADVVLSPASWQATADAAGAACAAAAAVWRGDAPRAFCAIRPPGHHAGVAKAEGFCLLNNAVIAAMHVQSLGAARVAIADFDVHHGNGSEAIIKARGKDLFYASTHQYPLYPQTGGPDTDVAGVIINRPLAAGSAPAVFHAAWEEEIIPALRAFAPDVLIISAGFDAHRDDPLAGLSLLPDDFARVTTALCGVQSKIVSVLEGGYDLPALSESVRAHLLALATA